MNTKLLHFKLLLLFALTFLAVLCYFIKPKPVLADDCSVLPDDHTPIVSNWNITSHDGGIYGTYNTDIPTWTAVIAQATWDCPNAEYCTTASAWNGAYDTTCSINHSFIFNTDGNSGELISGPIEVWLWFEYQSSQDCNNQGLPKDTCYSYYPSYPEGTELTVNPNPPIPTPTPTPSNQAPSVNANGPYQVNEGGTVQLNATGNDPENGPLTYSWDLDNNGSYETPGQNVTFSAATYDGLSNKTVSVQTTDNGNLTGIDNATVNVINVAPTVGAINSTTDPVQINTPVSATANFTDPGIADNHTAVWDWGDGTTNGNVTETNGSGSVTDSHTYTQSGVYTITLTVTDDDGGQGASPEFQYVSVYDPTPQALFSGARMFTSPDGAYIQNASLTGTVKFGVSSRYNGSSASGHVNMTLDVANVEFVSSAISSLVISNGKAYLRGTGSINNAGSYTFLVSGLDGQNINSSDYVRFQIKDSSNVVVYDTQPGASDLVDPTTSVTGQIIIH